MLTPLQQLLEAVLLAAGEPVTRARLARIVGDEVDAVTLDEALRGLAESYADRGVELVEVASGLRIQARERFAPWIRRLQPERQTRYSRAVLETLALIAWRQPITRAEIEAVRGVAVHANIIRTLQERGWISVVGRKETPGRPEMFATTKQFLDDFNLSNMDELARRVFSEAEVSGQESHDKQPV